MQSPREPKPIQLTTTPHLKRPRQPHTLLILREPALRLLKHAIPRPHLHLTFVLQLRHILRLGLLVQLVQLPRGVIADVGGVEVVVDVEAGGGVVFGVGGAGLEVDGGAGGEGGGEEGGEQGEDEED